MWCWRGHTTFGARNKIFSFACLGVAPQDLKYAGEATGARFGDDNTIREYVTVSRGDDGRGRCDAGGVREFDYGVRSHRARLVDWGRMHFAEWRDAGGGM